MSTAATRIVLYEYCVLGLIQPFICIAQVSPSFLFTQCCFTFAFVYILCVSGDHYSVSTLATNLINEPWQAVFFEGLKGKINPHSIVHTS